ncbi:MAG: hypothetical protein M3Y87_14110 [Myxococcota bacterium]|nr:hypothetical protein [Myxococcota bacterium]
MADEYERTQMPGVGEVLLRHKVTSPRWLIAGMIGFPITLGALAAAGLAIVGQTLPALAVLAGAAAMSALFTFLNVTFSTARVAISEGEIHIQIGLAGPKIPIAEVARVSLAPSGVNKIGMGVGNDLRGTTYYRMWGSNDRAVHVERTDGSKIILVVKEPDAMANAIDEALARAKRRGPRVRVELDAGGENASEPSERAAPARRQAE